MATIDYTESQATDEALRMITRRFHRLHPAEYSKIIVSLPEGLREALSRADMRADTLTHTDRTEGTTRTWPVAMEDVEE